jgi:hypothetical protein
MLELQQDTLYSKISGFSLASRISKHADHGFLQILRPDAQVCFTRSFEVRFTAQSCGYSFTVVGWHSTVIFTGT